jgi:hypothetical protein
MERLFVRRLLTCGYENSAFQAIPTLLPLHHYYIIATSLLHHPLRHSRKGTYASSQKPLLFDICNVESVNLFENFKSTDRASEL